MPQKGAPHHTPTSPHRHLFTWACALLLHAIALAPLTSSHSPQNTARPSNSALRQKNMKTHRVAVTYPKQRPKKKPEEKNKPETQPKGQIVEIAPNKKQEIPEKSKYLSEYNNKVERETRSRHASAFHKNVMQEVTTPNKGPVPEQAPSETNPKPSVEKNPSPPSLEGNGQALRIPKTTPLEKLLLPSSSLYGTYAQTRPVPQKISGPHDSLELPRASSEKEEATQPTLQPWAAPVGLNASLAGGPMNDHLKNIDEGDGTFLNTREFKYAAFFNRFKRDVAQKWTPWLEYSRRDPTGNIYGKKNRFTVVWITLGPDGSLQRTRVDKSSGIDFLDEEATAAIQRAAPFPNPPKALRDSVGLVEFPFGFTVEFDTGF